MKAKELRIGNLTYRIEVKNKNNTVIDDITIYDMERIQEVHDKTFTYEPIPLTEEWLLRFNWNGYNPMRFNHNFEIDKQGRLYCNSDYKGVNVNYVHQLQNLYFALNNKELEYNNKM
jgi:hypothetical protein